jgi:hypothetical protein
VVSEPDDATVIKVGSEPDDATVMSSRNSVSSTIDSPSGTTQFDEATVIAPGRKPSNPEALVGSPVEFSRPGEPVAESITRTDYVAPPARKTQNTDPAALFERTMKSKQRRARVVALLLVASAVVVGIAVAVTIVILTRI